MKKLLGIAFVGMMALGCGSGSKDTKGTGTAATPPPAGTTDTGAGQTTPPPAGDQTAPPAGDQTAPK